MHFRAKHLIAEIMLYSITIFGWLLAVVGIIFGVTGFGNLTTDFLSQLIGGIGVFFLGMITVASSQMAVAVIDNTNANREILHMLKQKKENQTA